MEKKLAAAEQQLFIDYLRAWPDLKLAELVKLTRGRMGRLLRTIKIGDLVARPKSHSRRQPPFARKAVMTRTSDERARYDEAVFQQVTVSPKPVSTVEIRAAVGGTPLQGRKALRRLIEIGRIERQGKARATRYRAVQGAHRTHRGRGTPPR